MAKTQVYAESQRALHSTLVNGK